MQNLIESIMETKGTPTLKAIAGVFGLPATRLYSVAKQPREGEVYDAKVFNWDAIERFVARRLDADKGLETIEDVIDKALELDVEYQAQDGRRSSRGTGVNKKIEVDGKEIPIRKFPNFEADANMFICLKKDDNVYKIVYQTVSHTVLVPVNKDGETVSHEVKVISNFMLNMRGIGPVPLELEMNERFQKAELLAQA